MQEKNNYWAQCGLKNDKVTPPELQLGAGFDKGVRDRKAQEVPSESL
jgi:hypothetical protein